MSGRPSTDWAISCAGNWRRGVGSLRVFREIGDLFAPVDLALLPIGAYDPRWFMAPVHVAPEEAVSIHRDIGARQSVAMHWGTFVLTDEPMDEPPRRLRQALERQGVSESAFRVMQHGEVWCPSSGVQPGAGGQQSVQHQDKH